MTNLYDDIEPGSARLSTPRSALTVGAHPDDAEFGAGGTLARWTDSGCHVTILVVSDGSKGSWDPALSPADLIDRRRAEQRAAADVLGAADVIHLDHVDGEIENTIDLRAALCRSIRTIRPDVVLGHDPWRRYLLHPDHRAVGLAMIDSVVAARDHLFFPEQGLDKHRPEAILLWQADVIDQVEDISATFDRKIGALMCHSSQTTTTMGDAAASPEARSAFVERIRGLAAEHGRTAGLELGEGFKLLRP